MKKKFLQFIFILCLIFPASFIFSACAPNVVDLTLNGELEIYIGTFSIDDYTLTVELSDETTEQIALSADFISADDLAKLSTLGTHTITVNYNGYSEEFTIIVKKHTFSDLVFNDVTYTYDGTAKTIEVENVPTGASVEYSMSNTQTNAGTYDITATVTLENYETATLDATLTIDKATYDMSGVSFITTYYTYDGENKLLEIKGDLPEGISVEYYHNNEIFTGATNVGTYHLTAKFSGENSNYKKIPDKTATMHITFASYDLSGVKFISKTETYDGTVKTIALTGELPEGVTVKYFSNGSIFTGATNVGTYTVVAVFTSTNPNYSNPSNKSATLTIEKANVDMSNISFDDSVQTFDGTTKSIQVSGDLPSWIKVSYYYDDILKTGVVDNGTYFVEAKFTHSNGNYKSIPSKYATLVVNKANFDSSTLKFEDKTVVYDGDYHGLFVEGLPIGLSVTYYCDNREFYATSYVGTYEITARFNGKNYYSIEDRTATLTIKKAVYDMSGVSLEDKTVVYDGEMKSIEVSGTLPYRVSVIYYYDGVRCNGVIEDGEHTVVAKFGGDYDCYEVIPDMSATLTITREQHTITFKQEGQPDIVKYVLDMADFTDIPEPNNEGIEKGYGYVWQEADYTCVTSSFEVFAEFKKMVYTITYDYGDATVPAGSPTTYMVDTETIVFELPTLSGHKLFGLYANDNFKEPITEIPKGSTGNIKITAWFDVVTPGLVIGGGTVISYNGTAKNVYIPATHNGSTVTEIYDNAFKGKDIQMIKLPETITWIGANAFENCTNLYSIHIPSAVDTIEWFAFQGCSSLEIVTFGEGIELNYSSEIPQGMFNGCSSIKEIVIPKSIARIGDKAFYNCVSLEKLTFDEGSKINLIGSYNFNDCKITEVIFPANDVWIGIDAFSNCQYLATVSFGGDCGVDAVADGAFANCIALTSIVISKDLNTGIFAKDAFEGCINLKTVYNFCTRITLTPGGTNYAIEKYAENIYTTR